MLNIEITHNLDQLVVDLNRFITQISDLTDFFESDVHPYLADQVDAVFDLEPWVELSEKYDVWKSRHYPWAGILELTGNLRRSYISNESIIDVSPDELIFGTDVEYAFYHEFGITPPGNKGPLPKRSVLENLPENIDYDIGVLLETHIDDLLRVIEEG